MTVLLHVILAFIRIGTLPLGGGYAVLVLTQKGVVEMNRWTEAKEFINIVAVAEMTPGPIAVNSSTYVGFKLYGPGMGILLTFCMVLIPFVLVLPVSHYFRRFKDSENLNLVLTGTRPAVIGIIAAACFSIGRIFVTRIHSLIFFLPALSAVAGLKIHPILVLVRTGVLEVVYYLYLLPLF